jgi:hypothetical protein
MQWNGVEALDQLDHNLCGWAERFVLVGIQVETRITACALIQWQRFEQAIGQFTFDQVARQPGKAQAAANPRDG